MSAGIASFLAKGTGPRELRSALRLKTKRLGALLQALDTVKTVRAELPHNVLGGDLLELLSNRMRELLQNEEEARTAVAAVLVRRSRFTDRTAFVRPPKSAFPLNSEPGRSSAGGLAAWKPVLQERDPFPALPASQSIVLAAAPFAPPQQQDISQADRQPVRAASDNNRNWFPLDKGQVMTRKRSGEMVRSLLAAKLQEYWELGWPQETSKKDSNQISGAGAKSETSTAPQSPWHLAAQAPRSWPEITAQQVGRRIQSLAAGASSGHALQTINSSSPDKVEIQNIFNIEVKTEGGRGPGFADDLSERIANILREQALQHGIDIT